MSKLRENKPTADVLMVSMRAMGYSFESAVADVIDNSISAHANDISIKFPIDPADCYVAICDNGDGMTSAELFDAMKYGSESKRDGRSNDDLGRFGLGLKAASLSQCRKLTVISKKDGVISAFIWDLDIIEEKRDWYVIECSEEQITGIRFVDYLQDKKSGTVVLWENFDIIQKSTGDVYASLNNHMSEVADYLSLIFHRFLNRSDKQKVSISVNNFKLIFAVKSRLLFRILTELSILSRYSLIFFLFRKTLLPMTRSSQVVWRIIVQSRDSIFIVMND